MEAYKTIKITTPENIELEYALASLGLRGLAYLIDYLIQLAIVIVIAIVGLISFRRTDFILEEYLKNGWTLATMIIIVFVIYYGYFILFETVMKGQTPGKKALKLRVIRNNGQPITIIHVAIRNLFKVVLDVYGIGAMLIFFNKEYKRLGDMVASTIVIVEDKKEIVTMPQPKEEFTNGYKYIINKEEKQLIKDYLKRKETFKYGYKNIEDKLVEYFAKKFNIHETDINNALLQQILNMNR